MAIPVPGGAAWESAYKDVDSQFILALRENLVATTLVGQRPRFVRDLGIQAFSTWSLPEETGATISMTIPEFQPTDSALGTETVGEIPVFLKDAKVTERQRLAAESVGLDTAEAEVKGRALATELDRYVLFGKTGGPGATTGILNHAGITSVDNSGTTDWSDGNDAVADLNEAVATLLTQRHYGPYTVVMNPMDSRAIGAFITNTSVQVQEKLNPLINRNILWSEAVTEGDLYLTEARPSNYRAVIPRNVGAVGRVLRRSDVDEITGTLRVRWLTAMGLDKPRGATATVKVVFDFA